MEVEIDPLSMLEQTMQVSDYSVTSNGDEDVVMVNDDPVEVVARPMARQQPSKIMRFVRSSTVLPNSKDVGYVGTNGTPNVDNNSSYQDVGQSFGEHFLINPDSDYGMMASPSPSSPAEPVPPPPPPPPPHYNGKTSVRGTGLKKSRGARGGSSNRGRGSHNRVILTKRQQIAVDDEALLNAGIANSKLENNVKRLSYASTDEQAYRIKIFGDLQKVLNCRLDCTVCGSHIGCSVKVNVINVTHPLLKVLACNECRNNYCSTDWSLGREHKDVRCRWCSKPGSHKSTLYNCTNCPFAFCEACIVRNYCKRDWNKILRNDKWLCYVCQMVPLYFMRATCWALHMYTSTLNRRKSVDTRDMSKCCKTNVDTIDLDDEETSDVNGSPSSSLQPEPSGVSSLPLTSRVDVFFNSVDSVRQNIKSKMNQLVSMDTLNNVDTLDNLVSDINMKLATIGSNVESCLEYIDNWRTHVLDVLKNQKNKKEKQKSIQISQNNNHWDYSTLLKEYNIKPCQVILERVQYKRERQETSQPPNFFLSLVPDDVNDSKESTDDDVKIIENTDDEIICLDD